MTDQHPHNAQFWAGPVDEPVVVTCGTCGVQGHLNEDVGSPEFGRITWDDD